MAQFSNASAAAPPNFLDDPFRTGGTTAAFVVLSLVALVGLVVVVAKYIELLGQGRCKECRVQRVESARQLDELGSGMTSGYEVVDANGSPNGTPLRAEDPTDAGGGQC